MALKQNELEFGVIFYRLS